MFSIDCSLLCTLTYWSSLHRCIQRIVLFLDDFLQQCQVSGSDPHLQQLTNLHFKMDLKFEIKEEPVYVEDTASTSYPAANIKDEIIKEEHTIKQLVPCFKEEDSVENVAISTVHSGERVHRCTICNMIFSQKVKLKKHVWTHSGRKPLIQCTLCSSTFSRKANLNKHIKVHSGQRPYVCKICRSTFREKSDLNRHIGVHTGERPYCCDLCGTTFRRKYVLEKHISIHCGEKLFSCDVCCNTFRSESALKSHDVIHSGQRPYSCKLCSKTYTRAGSLRTHMIFHS